MPQESNNFILSGNDDSTQGTSASVIPPSDQKTDLSSQTQSSDSFSDSTAHTAQSANAHDINISDTAPIVMLFGPPSSGKSMTLVRLAKYLRDKGFTITPDPLFKGGEDYKARCEKFKRDLDTSFALQGTGLNEFLMVKVGRNGNSICQILEAPGEDYFKPNDSDSRAVKGFRAYINKINATKNRRIWVLIAEANWNPVTSDGAAAHNVKNEYIDRIKACEQQLIKDNHGVILLFNQIDKKSELFVSGGRINEKAAFTAMKQEYPGLVDIFRNLNPITKMWKPYKFTFVPFTTGTYNVDSSSTAPIYTISDDKYPRRLWEAIQSLIKG